jgi:DNA-binding response OmpR family regulator
MKPWDSYPLDYRKIEIGAITRTVRDDSLAQLVRRLREKIESDPSNPRLIISAPGRGYLCRK